MAVKHDPDTEKQSSEIRTSLQGFKPGKSESVNAMVSRYLAELKDLSPEMDQKNGSAAKNMTHTQNPTDVSYTLPHASGTESDMDVESINREIEDSLAQLETLRPACITPLQEILPPTERAKPAPAAAASVANTFAEVKVESTSADPEEQAWERIELFRNAIASNRRERQFPITWIFAALIFLGILGAAAFYYVSR